MALITNELCEVDMNSPISGHRSPWRCAVLSLVLLAAVSPAWCQDGESSDEEPAVDPIVAAHPLINFATIPVRPDSKPFAILSIPLSVNDCTPKPIIRQQHLRRVSFIIEDRGGLDLTDFKPLTKDEKSGLALFAESGDVPEFFHYAEGDPTSDIPLFLQKAPEIVQMATGFKVTFDPVPIGGWTQIPIDADAFPDFYVVARSSIEMRHGDSFEAYMLPGMVTIEDRDPSIGTFKRFDLRFPSTEFGENLSTCLGFATLDEYSKPSIFQCDIVQLYNYTRVGQRLSNRSEPTTLVAMDLIGAPTEEYFVREIRLNFVAVDMYPISWLWDSAFGGAADGDVGGMGSVHSISGKANDGFIQFDYLNSHVPKFLQNPQLYETFPPPLSQANEFGLSIFDRTNPRRARFLMDRARDRARTPTPDVLLGLLKDEPGGIFVFAEGEGGTPGVYESTVDRLLVLDEGVRFENLDINTVPPDIINRLLPTELLKSNFSLMPTNPITGEVDLSFLLRDEPLDWLFLPGLAMMLEMYGGFEAPDGLKIDETFVENYRVAPRDFSWDSGKYWLGLSRELIDFLLEDAALEAADEDGDELPDGDGIDNCTEIFGRQLISGFTMVLPLAPDNPKELLRVPPTDSVAAGTDPPEMYIAIQTSDGIRNLDSILPFVLPGDVRIGKSLDTFAEGQGEPETLPSLARVGHPKPGLQRLLSSRPEQERTLTNPLIGRPRPQFAFQDLTQPGPGENANNDNIIGGPGVGSPPKAVIGINAIDFGQNCNLMFNSTTPMDAEAGFFTECTVFDTITVDFLPAPGETAFNTEIINGVTTAQGIDASLNRIISTHQVILYVDDDTPVGDFRDNDGDGMIDEELVNLIDDDGDGLIDEDCGDGDPVGRNGVFDEFDDFILPLEDHYGPITINIGSNFFESAYKRAVNHGLIIPDPENPDSEGEEIAVDGAFSPLVPIVAGSGVYRARFDLHPLSIGTLPWGARNTMLPLTFRMFDGPFDLAAEKNTAVLDLTLDIFNKIPLLMQPALPAEDGKVYLPAWGDIIAFDQVIIDAITSAAGSGENVAEIDLDSIIGDNGTPLGIAPADGAASLTDLRFVDPTALFSRYGQVPLIVNSGGDAEGNPQGGNPPDPIVVSQFGWYVGPQENADQMVEYVNNFVESVNDAHEQYMESLQDAIDTWNEEVATYQEEYAEWEQSDDEDPGDPPEPPEFDPDSLPEASEISLADPDETFGLNAFPPDQDLSYEYYLQIPDENFGPLRGNDYYVVLRTAHTAEVGDRFQVRMDTGSITYTVYNDTNEIYSDNFRGQSNSKIVTSPIVVRSGNVPPEFEFVSPAAGNNVADENLEFEISWLSTDPDNDATINLYVDTDNKDFDGTLLVAGLTEGVDTRHTIRLPDDIPAFDPGLKYYIYAQITDGVNPQVSVYADGPIVAKKAGTGEGDEGISVDPRGDQVDYYKLTRDGRIFNLGDSPSLGSVAALGGTRLAIDMELAPDYAGAVVLATDGRVFGVGNVGMFNDMLAGDREIVFPDNPLDDPQSGLTIEFARDVEVDFEQGAIYILDMDGDFVALGENALPNLQPGTVVPGLDVYRDMELSSDHRGMYFLTFAGKVTGSGSASASTNLGFNADLARDLVLSDSGGVLILDAYGRLHGGGPANRPPVSNQPVYRGVARIPNMNSYLLVQGGGLVRAATEKPLIMPIDVAQFGDEPGLTDDRVVDIESAAFNLLDVPNLLTQLFNAFSREDLGTIQGLLTRDYLDEQGNDRRRIERSLRGFFDFFEVQSFRTAPGQESVTVSFQGSKVIVEAEVDWVLFDPRIDRFTVDDGTVGQTEFVVAGFPDDQGSTPGIPFSQTVTVREVSDGRGWETEIWDINNTMNQSVAEFTMTEFQGQEGFSRLERLKSLNGNKKIAHLNYVSREAEFEEKIRFSYKGPNALNHLMMIHRQFLDPTIYAPPLMEFMWYDGQNSQGSSVIRIEMENIDGRFKISSLRMPTRMFVNSFGPTISAEAEVGTGGIQEEASVDIPDGFSFSRGSLAPTLQSGDADLIMESETRLAVTRRTQGILNLGANVDIFSLSTRDLLNSINKLRVLLDPLDPEANTPYSTNAVIGNSYFVILRDGKHFALITLVDVADPTAEGGGEIAGGVLFDWAYRDSFVLPPDF